MGEFHVPIVELLIVDLVHIVQLTLHRADLVEPQVRDLDLIRIPGILQRHLLPLDHLQICEQTVQIVLQFLCRIDELGHFTLQLCQDGDHTLLLVEVPENSQELIIDPKRLLQLVLVHDVLQRLRVFMKLHQLQVPLVRLRWLLRPILVFVLGRSSSAGASLGIV